MRVCAVCGRELERAAPRYAVRVRKFYLDDWGSPSKGSTVTEVVTCQKCAMEIIDGIREKTLA